MQEFITAKREEIAELCRKHHVRRLAVFGSAVRDDFDPERSDVDVVVEFEAEALVNLRDHYRDVEEGLVRLLGRDVDIVREGTIRNPYILRRVVQQQEQLYAA